MQRLVVETAEVGGLGEFVGLTLALVNARTAQQVGGGIGSRQGLAELLAFLVGKQLALLGLLQEPFSGSGRYGTQERRSLADG